MRKIGILHPGEMGISIAAATIRNGHKVYWVATGRSERTHQRAHQQNLIELQSLTEFCQLCEVIISICPPHAAEEVARLVIAESFKGIYLDANAISPQRTIRLSQIFEANHIPFIDGSIIGGPALNQGETCLYLSGKGTEIIADCFQDGPLEINILGDNIGRASALKMCYAAYSKGTTALLISILAAADILGVLEVLYSQWEMDDPGFVEQVNRRVIRAAAKAWRFEGEMKEIASTFGEVGLPDGFHEAAAEIFHRMANLKSSKIDTMDQLLIAVTKK